MVDYRAVQMERRHGSNCLAKSWPITGGQQARLEKRCHIPLGRDSVAEGRYSWNAQDDSSDNCSSWALRVVNHVMGSPEFLTCSAPKRLAQVEAEVFGSEPDATSGRQR